VGISTYKTPGHKDWTL
jgi:hypothetical protein